jgi:hypothetical protein
LFVADEGNKKGCVTINLPGGFLGTLTIVFVVLKLCGVIEWSWWWVLSPLWIPAALFALGLLFCLGVAIIVDLSRK